MGGRFANPDPRHRPHGAAAIWRWAVWDRLTRRRRVAPAGPSAGQRPLQLEAPSPSLTWLGHASFLLRLGKARVAVDPVLSGRIGWLYRRHGRTPLHPRQLPALDALLVTHNHYDHLDGPTLAAIDPATPVVVPSGLGRWMARRFSHVVELGWWESTRVDGLEITLVPARHWSRRGLFDVNRSLWGGFVVRGAASAVYHAGDSAHFDGFAEVGRRFPGLDAALLPIGGYRPGWFMQHNHMTPEQAGRAFLACGARWMVPMHWGTFQLTDEPIAEPAERLADWWRRRRPADGRRLAVLEVGETLSLADTELGP